MSRKCSSTMFVIILMLAALMDFGACLNNYPGTNYMLLVGRTSNKKLATTEYYGHTSSMFVHNEDFVTYDYDHKIVGIEVLKTGDQVPERVALVTGGPGYEYFTLYFRSQKGEKMSAKINIYVDDPYHS
ncbi:hypothetical protein QAD02_010608 [Eretmocerus hayati]|uniref:Uncharacterized protein n=1 Tax=Eretmocerus hayati TaxID=131215 RepID=A0ACC2NUR1_9HYME|nr:hypothetical protein QAD02_010608 [Eretmocerus hayati]